MSQGHYRGRFWRPGEEPVPGSLEISDNGELRLECQGLLSGNPAWGELGEVERIEGEIANSPFSGSIVTLFNCIAERKRSGTGGPWERWWAHLALIGNDSVEVGATFDRIELGLRGLHAFIRKNPPLDEGEGETVTLPRVVNVMDQFIVDDWQVASGWRTSRKWGRTYLHLEQSPFFAVELGAPLTVETVLGDVAPVFEFLLTVSLRAHAEVETLVVRSSRKAYNVLAPRVAEPISSSRPIDRSELLFCLEEDSGGNSLIERGRQLLERNREFVTIFLGYERSPPRYVEDRLRASLLTLSRLPGVQLRAHERSREWLSVFENTPSAVRDFLPPPAMSMVPGFVRELMTPGVCQALSVDSPEAFSESMGPAFRWAVFGERKVAVALDPGGRGLGLPVTSPLPACQARLNGRPGPARRVARTPS